MSPWSLVSGGNREEAFRTLQDPKKSWSTGKEDEVWTGQRRRRARRKIKETEKRRKRRPREKKVDTPPPLGQQERVARERE